jgi:hypothetical protein
VWLNYTVLPPVGNANTLLLTPANNTTLATDALGEPRYVGEPDFDLIELNLTDASAPLTLDGLPEAGGSGTYSATFEPGLNNVLVPRGAFLYSPLGRALLNDTNESVSSTSGLGFSPWTWSYDAYVPGGEPLTGTNTIRVFAPSNESAENGSYYRNTTNAFAGVPGDPSIEQGVESRSIQAVMWVNITNSSGLGNETEELTDLLAGLLLNSSGNVSYQATNVSGQLSWLTLPATVLAVLGSKSLANSGSFGLPVYDTESNYSSGGSFLESIWNAISDAAGYVVHVVEETTTWLGSTYLASQDYITGAVSGAITAASNGLRALKSQTVIAVRSVHEAMEWAWDQLVSHVRLLLTDLIDPITEPILLAMNSYARAVEVAVWHAQNDTRANGTLAPEDAYDAWAALSGPVFTVALGLSAAVVTALTILSTVDIGPSFLVDVLIGLLIGTLSGLAIQALMESEGSEFASLTSGSIYALEAYVNSTDAGSSQTSQTPWTTVALLVSSLESFQLGFPLSLFELQRANGFGGAFVSGAISLALDLAGIVLFVAHLIEPVPIALLILGVAFGLFSLTKTLYLLESDATLPSLRPVLGVNAILQIINLGSAVYGLFAAL